MGAAREIEAIRAELETAADTLIDAASTGLGLVLEARAGDMAALNRLQDTLHSILEACAFQDLIGQRLSRLADGANGLAVVAPADPLLNGPADFGLDQAAADRLFRGD